MDIRLFTYSLCDLTQNAKSIRDIPNFLKFDTLYFTKKKKKKFDTFKLRVLKFKRVIKSAKSEVVLK